MAAQAHAGRGRTKKLCSAGSQHRAPRDTWARFLQRMTHRAPNRPWVCTRLGRPPRPGPHLDGPLQLRLLVAEPQHSDDGQGHTEPVEEAEEVDDGEDVGGEGIQQGHDALQAERRGSVSPRGAWAGAGNRATRATRAPDDGGHPMLGRVCRGLTAPAHSRFKGRPTLSNTQILRKQRRHCEGEGAHAHTRHSLQHCL